MSNRFSEVGEMIYACDWYTFPNELQRILPTVLMLAHQPVPLEGFVNLKCTREAFKTVNLKPNRIKTRQINQQFLFRLRKAVSHTL